MTFHLDVVLLVGTFVGGVAVLERRALAQSLA